MKFEVATSKYNPEGYLSIQYGESKPFTPQEAKEFRTLLRKNPSIRRSYKDFRMESAQALRSRLGRYPFVDDKLDYLFEVAVISGIK